MRNKINDDVKAAMKSGDKVRLGTLRLITAALKDRELGIGQGAPAGGGDLAESDIVQVLQKMVKQRRDSIAQYQQANRADLVAKEEAEVAVIEAYLPRQMDAAQTAAAIDAAIAESGAAGVKDMGKVMAVLKQKHAAVMDFGKASGLVKARLGG